MLSCRDVSQTLQVGHQEWDRQHGGRNEELALDAPIASQPRQSSVDRSRVCPITINQSINQGCMSPLLEVIPRTTVLHVSAKTHVNNRYIDYLSITANLLICMFVYVLPQHHHHTVYKLYIYVYKYVPICLCAH